MVINEIRLKEDSRRVQRAVQQPQQRQWSNLDNALQKSLTWNDIGRLAPLRISFPIRSVYDHLPSDVNLVHWGKKRRCHLSAMQWQADHIVCLKLMQSSPARRTLHMEATYRGHRHG